MAVLGGVRRHRTGLLGEGEIRVTGSVGHHYCGVVLGIDGGGQVVLDALPAALQQGARPEPNSRVTMRPVSALQYASRSRSASPGITMGEHMHEKELATAIPPIRMGAHGIPFTSTSALAQSGLASMGS
jgi:hypothetical protein